MTPSEDNIQQNTPISLGLYNTSCQEEALIYLPLKSWLDFATGFDQKNIAEVTFYKLRLLEA